MYPHHVFDLEPIGTFGMYPICYQWVSGRYFQPEPAMYSRCFHWFPGPLAPSAIHCIQCSVLIEMHRYTKLFAKHLQMRRLLQADVFSCPSLLCAHEHELELCQTPTKTEDLQDCTVKLDHMENKRIKITVLSCHYAPITQL